MRSGWGTVAAAVFVAGCSLADTDASGARSGQQDTGTAEAVASAAPAPDYYPADYVPMTQAARIFAEETFGDYMRIPPGGQPGDEPTAYTVEDCQSWLESAEIAEGINGRTQQLEELSREIAKHRHYLAQLYPAAVWQEPLRAYEKARLAHIAAEPDYPPEGDTTSAAYEAHEGWSMRTWAIQQAFARAMETRRHKLAPKAIPVEEGGGCGAGETPYRIATKGKGRVWMTPKFQFDLCRARKLDPWDTKLCRWTEATADKELYLSGRYVYQAKWPDGATRRDVRVFDGTTESEEIVTVTIDKP